jgi:hypothetical protein
VTDRDRLLSDERDAWALLCEWFERVPPERFEAPTLTPEGWSPKDAMFHISGWTADCAAQLDRIAAGSFDPGEETREAIERQNLAWFEISRSMSPADVRTGFEASRLRMIDAFAAITEISPVAVEWFEESGALHYATHAEDLRAFLGRGS